MWWATSRRRTRRTSPTIRTLALPGIRVGRAGVEKYHERDLRGTAGAVQLEVNAYGRVIRELDRQEGMPGEEVDADHRYGQLQQVALGHLGEESASAVVLDCRNGEVLAMATAPRRSIRRCSIPACRRRNGHEWVSNDRAPLINKATSGLYAPGSTFKMAVAMAALEAGAVRPADDDRLPRLSRPRRHASSIAGSKGGHGTLDLHGGLKNSCDVFFYETARRTGIDRIAAMAHRFGLGTKLDRSTCRCRPTG